MASKLQIKPIKNNPLFAKLKAKKKGLKLGSKSSKLTASNNASK